MRSRSGACHAEFYEEYIQKIKVIDSIDTKPKGLVNHVSPYNVSYQLDTGNKNNLFSSQGHENHSNKNTFNDFAFSPEDKQMHEAQDEVDRTNEQKNAGSPQLGVKTIIIGGKNVPRHAFVHALVPGESEEKAMKSSLDLIVKTYSDDERTIKCQFWIKDCNEEEEEIEKFKGIYKVYYNFVSSLIFVYSVHDRSSFILLKKSIEEIKKSIGIEGIKVILLGLMSTEPEHQREVDYSEGNELMNQEGLAGFIETNMMESSVKNKILDFLCNRAESQILKNKLKTS